MKIYYVPEMNSNTHFPKKTSKTATLKEQSSSSILILNDGENTEFLEKEQAWFDRWENEHLSHADIDLHY